VVAAREPLGRGAAPAPEAHVLEVDEARREGAALSHEQRVAGEEIAVRGACPAQRQRESPDAARLLAGMRIAEQRLGDPVERRARGAV